MLGRAVMTTEASTTAMSWAARMMARTTDGERTGAGWMVRDCMW